MNSKTFLALKTISIIVFVLNLIVLTYISINIGLVLASIIFMPQAITVILLSTITVDLLYLLFLLAYNLILRK